MLGISLKIIKGMLLLTVLSQLRLNIDDSSWFVHAKEIFFFFNPDGGSFEWYFHSSLFVGCSYNLFRFDSNVFEICMLSKKFISAGFCAEREDES